MDLQKALLVLAETRDELRCRCHVDYTMRGSHGPDCKDYLVDDLDKVIELILKRGSK